MNTGNTGPGIVLERSDVRIINSEELPWEDHPGIAGAKIRVLARDDVGNASVYMNWLPPGFQVPSPEPYRHYHETVFESGFLLEGELRMCEYANAEDRTGVSVSLKPGFFFQRMPHSIHGLKPGEITHPEMIILEWRTGPGTYHHEKAYPTESVVVPF